MWVGDADWRLVSIVDSFWVEAERDTVLLRLPGTVRGVGMGREIHALECASRQRKPIVDDPSTPTDDVRVALGCRFMLTRTQMTNAMVDTISPYLDIAKTSRASRAILRHASTRKVALGNGRREPHVSFRVDSAGVDGGEKLGKRDRTAETTNDRRTRRRVSVR